MRPVRGCVVRYPCSLCRLLCVLGWWTQVLALLLLLTVWPDRRINPSRETTVEEVRPRRKECLGIQDSSGRYRPVSLRAAPHHEFHHFRNLHLQIETPQRAGFEPQVCLLKARLGLLTLDSLDYQCLTILQVQLASDGRYTLLLLSVVTPPQIGW